MANEDTRAAGIALETVRAVTALLDARLALEDLRARAAGVVMTDAMLEANNEIKHLTVDNLRQVLNVDLPAVFAAMDAGDPSHTAMLLRIRR